MVARRPRSPSAGDFTIPGVPGIDSGKITVAGLRPDNVAGPMVTAKLKAAPRKVCPRKRGKARKRCIRRNAGRR